MDERKHIALPSKKKAKGILGLRISKRSYIFNIRRRFENIREFKVEKKVEGLEAVRKLAESRFKSLIRVDPHKMAKMPVMPKSPGVPKGVLIGLAAILILLVGAIAYFMLLLSSASPVLPPAEPSGSSLSLSPVYEDLAWYGHGHFSVGTASIIMDSENVSKVNLSYSLYSSPVARRVVLVETSRSADEFETQFLSELSALFKADGSSVETIYIDQLRHAPPSFAVYVIMSDFMPAPLLGIEGGRDVIELTTDGSVFIFAGFPFTSALSERGGTVPVAAEYLVSEYGLSFQPSSEDFKGLGARNPLYAASTRAEGSFSIYGPVLVNSFGSTGNSGKLVIIPQTLSGGWDGNATTAANDMFNLIRRAPWLKPLAQDFAELSFPAGSEVISLTTSPTQGLLGSDIYAYVLADVLDDNNGSYTRSLLFPKHIEESLGGVLLHDPVVLPMQLSGRRLTMLGSNLSTVSVPMEIRAYSGGKLVSTTPIGSWLSFLQYDYAVELAPGDYIFKLVDVNGVLYAKSYLHVPELSVEEEFYSWERGIFRFRLLSDGELFDGDIVLSNVQASLDGKEASSLTLENGILTFQSQDAPFPAGLHTFEFSFGAGTFTQTVDFRPLQNWWDENEYRAAILIVIVVFFIGYALKRPDVEKYGLDVPDFLPLSKIAIHVKRQTVLEIFNSVNREYKWKYMPLKISELKSGFRKIMHKGKGILIGDYNTERLMEQLAQEGKVKRVLSLYALSGWEKTSGRSARYLAIFRKMRDVLVNSAIRFDELNSSKDYDTLIGLGGGTAVHIYDPSPSFIRRVLAGSQKPRQLILFANDAEKVQWEEFMDSTSKARMMVKMLASSGRLSLITVDELGTFVKRIS